jgi:hypothetical protein
MEQNTSIQQQQHASVGQRIVDDASMWLTQGCAPIFNQPLWRQRGLLIALLHRRRLTTESTATDAFHEVGCR